MLSSPLVVESFNVLYQLPYLAGLKGELLEEIVINWFYYLERDERRD
jgi:hypothetical protein